MRRSIPRLLLEACAIALVALVGAPSGNAEPTPLSCVDESMEPWGLVITIDVPGTTGTYLVMDEPKCTIAILDP